MDPADGSEVNGALPSLENLEIIVVGDLNLASVDAAAASGNRCYILCHFRSAHVEGWSK